MTRTFSVNDWKLHFAVFHLIFTDSGFSPPGDPEQESNLENVQKCVASSYRKNEDIYKKPKVKAFIQGNIWI